MPKHRCPLLVFAGGVNFFVGYRLFNVTLEVRVRVPETKLPPVEYLREKIGPHGDVVVAINPAEIWVKKTE